ncbi:MAG: flagellar motor switch protein FliG [Ignavibacteriales bacterium]|nr:flagellar motor switch protein FliG [Ignavibacteriales bacterium]
MDKKTSPSRAISNKQKAALLMLSLDVEAATRLMKGLTSEEIEFLTVEIASLKGVHSLQIDTVIEEFHQLITAQEYVVQGGWEFAQKLLESSLGASKARSVMDKVKTLTHVTGFAMLKKADPKQLASFLQKEHPQTIALVLSNLSGDQTAGVLAEFPDDLRNEVVLRIATLGKVSPTLLTEIEDVLSEVAEAEISQNMSTVGGTKSVANVLNKINNATAKGILEFIELKDGNLANEVKRLMFMFEDLVYIDDRGIQRLLREVDKKDLALSMKVADENLKEKIYKNMSERAQELLREELQFMGPVRLKEVEAAQTRIVMIIRQLEDSGELVVAGRGGKEEVVV